MEVSQCLNELDVPANPRDRAVILSKMTGISKQQAWVILEGNAPTDDDILQRVFDELEMDIKDCT